MNFEANVSSKIIIIGILPISFVEGLYRVLHWRLMCEFASILQVWRLAIATVHVKKNFDSTALAP